MQYCLRQDALKNCRATCFEWQVGCLPRNLVCAVDILQTIPAMDRVSALQQLRSLGLRLVDRSQPKQPFHTDSWLAVSACRKGKNAIWRISSSVGALPTDTSWSFWVVARGCSYAHLMGGSHGRADDYLEQMIKTTACCDPIADTSTPAYTCLGATEPLRSMASRPACWTSSFLRLAVCSRQ